jgi:hypothetical protein
MTSGGYILAAGLILIALGGVIFSYYDDRRNAASNRHTPPANK